MLSKNKIKLIQSLKLKKYRQKYGIFLAEGDKIIRSFLDMNHIPKVLYCTKEWWDDYQGQYSAFSGLIEITDAALIKQISLLTNPPPVTGLFECKPQRNEAIHITDFAFYLDGIQDPGNLGTIIRTLDWFGNRTLYLSKDCVDPFNPKAVQSSMGSLLNINFIEIDLDSLKADFTLYGTSLDGDPYDQVQYVLPALFILGNEGNGIRRAHFPLIERNVKIPGANDTKVDSLNAAVSHAIICAKMSEKKG